MMDEELKNAIGGFYDMADKMSAGGFPGSGEKLKTHMALVSVASAAANGGITENEMKCIEDYLDYPLDLDTVNNKILPAKLDNILREPPSELLSFAAAERLLDKDEDDPAGARFIDVVDAYLDELIMSDGSVDENETWIKDKYIDMMGDSLKKMRKACEIKD